MIVMYCFKWMLDTYELVDRQINTENTGKVFDPYKLLHIENDQSFNTEKIEQAFDRLSYKYHPQNVDKNKVPYLKAKKRYDNLVKAYETLTDGELYLNYIYYGDPEGSKTVKALKAFIPYWILSDDMRPMLITWGFIGGICLFLALSIM